VKRWALLALLLAGPAAGQQPARPVVPLDNLLAALKAAPNEQAAAALEAQIRQLWAQAASPAVRLLLARGMRELSEHAAGDALDSFDAALDLSPDLLEGWRGRAEARRGLGDEIGAVHDVEEWLRREPRSFLAFEELSVIAGLRQDWRGALAAWTKVLELSPNTPGGQERLRDLKRRALGEDM